MARKTRQISCEICVLGAGPAGVGAAYELSKAGLGDIVVVDRHGRAGGLSRTDVYHDHRFDVGPHRFFTANREINTLWRQVLGDEFRPVKRLTRIHYKNKFLRYPVSAFDALPKMGPIEAGHALLSYLYATLSRDAAEARSFEEWVSAKFGDKLYRSFFKTYTEKVWGIPCDQIGADWAAQRIKGLDLLEVVKNALGVAFSSGAKTLVDEFDYPVLGAGMMYERMAEIAAQAGLNFMFNSQVSRLERKGNEIQAVRLETPSGPVRVEAGRFLNTLPISRMLTMIRPTLEPDVLKACESLSYRDHITVNLVIHKPDLFPDQWIYVHSPEVQMARLANYRNFSPAMSSTSGTSPVSVEYFVFQSDPLWSMADGDLVKLAIRELEGMSLIPHGSAGSGSVVRETDSYPSYFLGYEEPFGRVKAAVARLSNLQLAGRGGLYKYNNMDHSLFSGILAARNLIQPDGPGYDVWQINIDAEYLEAAKRG